MKKYLLGFFLAAFIATSLQAQVKFASNFPQAGEKLPFTYQAQASLQEATNIEAYAYLNNGKDTEPLPIALQKTEKGWQGQVPTQSDTKSLMLVFFGENKARDYNNELGYTQILYDAHKKPLQGAYWGLYSISEALFLNVWIAEKQQQAWLAQELQLFPKNRFEYFWDLRKAMLQRDRKQFEKDLATIEARQNLSEEEMSYLSYAYKMLGQEAKADAIKKEIVRLFPEGNIAAYKAFDDPNYVPEADLDYDIQLYEELRRRVPNFYSDQMWDEIINSLKLKKIIQNNDKASAEAFLKALSPRKISEIASNISYFASELLEENGDIDLALLLADYGLEAGRKRDYQTEKKYKFFPPIFWQGEKNYWLAYILNIHGQVLSKKERYEDALVSFQEARQLTPRNQLTPEDFTHYLKAQDKVEQGLLEDFAKRNVADDEHKRRLRQLYIREKKSEEGFEEYLNAMEQEGKQKIAQAILTEAIKRKAPNFVLKDLDGKELSLKSLQGKVLVLDFWATWCGPCIHSFPGMQLAVEQYKNDQEVVFLFIATRDEEKNIREWAEKNKEKYSFYILLDSSREAANAFEVNGIPHKFVLDKKGNIRFSKLGYAPSPEIIRYELELMIESAKKG